MDGLTIGDVAKRAEVNIETVRYYERRDLVARPPRSMSNYRLYPEDAVRRVRFIKRAQELGFSLKEIQELLSLRATPKARCTDVRERALAKIHDIEERMRVLQGIRKALTKLAAECSSPRAPLSDCPILDSLDAEDSL